MLLKMGTVGIICLYMVIHVIYTSMTPIAKCVSTQSHKALNSSLRGIRNPSGHVSADTHLRRNSATVNLKKSNNRALASVSPPTDEKKPNGKDNPGNSDSGATYFSDLMSRGVDDIRKYDFESYAAKCEKAQELLSDALANVMPVYMEFISQKLQPSKEALGGAKQTGMVQLVHKNNNVLDDAVIGTIRHYMEMTKEGMSEKGGWFFSGGSRELSIEEQTIRLNQLLNLIIKLDSYLYKIFRDCMAGYKSFFLSKLFMGENTLLQLTEQRFANRIQHDFVTGAKKNIPKMFNISAEKTKLIGEILRYLAKADPSLADSFAKLRTDEADKEIVNKFSSCLEKWNVVSDVDEFTALVTKLNNGARSMLKRQLKDGEKQDKLLQVLTTQQQQIEAYQKQLGLQSQNNLPISCGFSYRMPNTNLNVVGSIQRGKGNIQISCVPDESARLLGPYGFTNGVLPGNLGLSVNIDI